MKIMQNAVYPAFKGLGAAGFSILPDFKERLLDQVFGERLIASRQMTGHAESGVPVEGMDLGEFLVFHLTQETKLERY